MSDRPPQARSADFSGFRLAGGRRSLTVRAMTTLTVRTGTVVTARTARGNYVTRVAVGPPEMSDFLIVKLTTTRSASISLARP